VQNFGNVDLPARLDASNLPSPSTSLPSRIDMLLSAQPDHEEGTTLELENVSLDASHMLPDPTCAGSTTLPLPVPSPDPLNSDFSPCSLLFFLTFVNHR
jgi:hypothetical protein